METNENLTSNFEQVIEVIGQIIYEYATVDIEPESVEEIKENQRLIEEFIDLASNGYSLVQWPDSQEFMEEDWFEEEAILALGSEEQTGSSAYFIPIKRIINGKS